MQKTNNFSEQILLLTVLFLGLQLSEFIIWRKSLILNKCVITMCDIVEIIRERVGSLLSLKRLLLCWPFFVHYVRMCTSETYGPSQTLQAGRVLF